MANQAAPRASKQNTEVAVADRKIIYTPLAETEPIELSIGMVKNILAVRSKSGREPSDADSITFLMLCKARRLNPFVKDAYLIGYDTKDGTKWSLITAIQALRKRAEANPHYVGTERGVIVIDKTSRQVSQREGTIVYDGEALLGGWARVHRNDRGVPDYEDVKLSAYDTGQSRWAKDPGGMIVKCGEAAALRRAFPSDLAGMYIQEEFDAESTKNDERRKVASASSLAELTKRLPMPKTLAIEAATAEAVDEPSTDQGIDEPSQDSGVDPPQDAEAIAAIERLKQQQQGNPAAPTADELADQEREERRSGGAAPTSGKLFEDRPDYR